ncbi:hypothetical protein BOSP111201_09520 [Bordetella sputigena]|uniref:hypothetical protein n=1 Tax=Bordetella sputigena TaxID=1416810 RepID=UPI0039EE4DFB
MYSNAINGPATHAVPVHGPDISPRFQAESGPPARASMRAARPSSRRGNLAAVRAISDRRAITLKAIREASQLLADGATDMRACARRFGLSQSVLRSFVTATGSLTDVGYLIDNGTLVAPGDRRANRMPPIERRATLTAGDFALADRLIGIRAGALSRTQFCDLFGFDCTAVYMIYNKDGTKTAGGEAAWQAARAAATSAGGSAAAMPQDPSNGHAATEQRLSALAEQAGMALGYWSGVLFRKIGMPGQAMAGDVDRSGDYWRIRPGLTGEYYLPAGPRDLEHIVDILRLSGKGAVASHYDVTPSADGQAMHVRPRATPSSGEARRQ